jgi:hypothetical protein
MFFPNWLNMSMRLDEIIDPVAIPPTPVARANRSADLIKLSVWLLHSLVGYLNRTDPDWHKNPEDVSMLLSVDDWKKYFPQGFPKLTSDVWQVFSSNRVVVGVRNLNNPAWHAVYDTSIKHVHLNSQTLLELIGANNAPTNEAIQSLMHELKHAYDDLKGKGRGLGKIVTNDYEKYLATPHEVRARFQEMEPDLIQELYFPDGSAKDSSYFKVVVPYLLQQKQLSVPHLGKQPQATQIYQSLIKQAHLLKQSFDKLTQSQRAMLIQQLKQSRQIGAATTWWQKIKNKLKIV